MPLYDFEHFCQRQADWSRRTFGSDDERGPVGPLKHLAKEVQEALDKTDDPEEYVDCLFLVVDAARRSKLFKSPADFIQQAFVKLAKNEKRQWQKPTSDEPVEHIRGLDHLPEGSH